MRGLLINNYYAVRANAKVFSGFMLLLGLFAAAVISQSLLIGYIFLAVIGFSVNMSSSLRKEFISKWGKYKLTAPVRRADIVKSHFISQLIWLFVGMAFAGAVVGLSWLLHGFPFDRNTDILLLLCRRSWNQSPDGSNLFPAFLFDRGRAERSGIGHQPACGNPDFYGACQPDQSVFRPGTGGMAGDYKCAHFTFMFGGSFCSILSAGRRHIQGERILME